MCREALAIPALYMWIQAFAGGGCVAQSLLYANSPMALISGKALPWFVLSLALSILGSPRSARGVASPG
jgi:hypothetical protein